MVYRPSSPVTVVRSSPVPSLVAVMVTPGMTAPAESVMVPVTSERPPCACTGKDASTTSAANVNHPSHRRIMSASTQVVEKIAGRLTSEPLAHAAACVMSLHKDHLLCAPVPDFADPQRRVGPTVDGVGHAEFLRHATGLSESADDLPGQLHLIDLAVVHALGIVRVGAEENLRTAARDAQRLRCADAADFRLEGPFAVEHLDALVAGVSRVQVARRIGNETADLVELALARARVPPRLHEVAVLRELRDPVVRAVAVRDVDVAGAIPRDIRWPIEAVAVDAGARRSASP